MIRRTFEEKGIVYASELALKNLTDLEKVVDWNIKNKVFLYRLSSEMFPWMSEYELNDLPDIAEIKVILKRVGEKAIKNGLRLTYHPGPFNVLAAVLEKVLYNTKEDLRKHAEILDMMYLPRSPFAKINIHVGGAYGDKQAAIKRFSENFQLLPVGVRERLTVENDDKANMFSVTDLLQIHENIGIPVVFDYLHHKFNTGGISEKQAFLAAVNTWPKDITPIVHYSASKKEFEDQNAPGIAHADYIHEYINTYGKEVDIMLEAKAKELAVIKYMEDFKIKL